MIIFFNQQIVKSKQKQTALDQKVRLEENRPRVISRFQKRPSVLLLASVMASDSTVDHSVGVTFALNYMERISPFWIEGNINSRRQPLKGYYFAFFYNSKNLISVGALSL